MTNQHIPVLILAQSGRFLAQAAKQAGYPVWVADCFGDIDTLSYASRWLAIPAISALSKNTLLATLHQLTQGQPCQLICGSGVESFHPLLTQLPQHIKLIGNSPTTIARAIDPSSFFETLNRLKINHPKSQLKWPNKTENWLIKANTGFGGSHVQYIDVENHQQGYYYQQYIKGQNASALFIANSKKAKLVSLNTQYVSDNAETPFQLLGLATPSTLSASNTLIVERIIEQLTIAFGLVGFNSIDFIIDQDDKLLLLEVNPRPSASLELLANHQPLFQLHIDACHGQLFDELPLADQPSSLFYHFASDDIIIPDNINWPASCHDLPKPGTKIQRNCPIFTSVLHGIEANSTAHQAIAKYIDKQLLEA